MGPSRGGTSSSTHVPTGTRSQSETLGFVLVVSMVILGSLTVVALGANALGQAEQGMSDERAETALTQFDSKAGLVALGQSDSQTVAFATDSGEQFEVHEGEGWISVEVENRTDSTNDFTVIDQEPLGTVKYRTDGDQMAYQGGGVWKATDDGGQMVSPPEFHYRNGTLTLPAVNVTGDAVLGNRAQITREGEVRQFPSETISQTNPLDDHVVTVTVQSEYYRGWGGYFEERTEGEVEYDHGAEEVTLTLLSPMGEEPVAAAVGSTAGDGDFTMQGNSAVTDSYNSTAGEYSATQSSNGNVTVAGDFDISGGSTVKGTVKTGGSFSCSGNSEVTGEIFWTDTFSAAGACSTGSDDKIDGVDGISPVSRFVNITVDDIEAQNDNGDTGVISGNQIADTSVNLDAGEYYVDDFTLSSSEELVIETDINETTRIAVAKYVKLEDDADISIQGNGRVELFVRGNDTTGGNHVLVQDGNEITTTDTAVENSSQFWVYGRENMQTKLGNTGGSSSVLEGVIYAPTSANGDSKVDIPDTEVYGGIVAGQVVMEGAGGQDSAVHFDTSLDEVETLPPSTRVVTVQYLHVSVNRIHIESA